MNPTPVAAPTQDAPLGVDAVGVEFRGRGGRRVAALRDVCLRVRPGEVLGVVGESGSGKTTLTRVLAGLHRPTTGEVTLAGRRLWTMPAGQRRALIARTVGLVLQDPASSMNPRLTVGAIVEDPLRIQRRGDHAGRLRRVRELLDTVQLARTVVDRRPAEISGGQRQRVAIARALALEPRFLLADEPTSALDVSLRAQLLDLLADLRHSHRLGILLVSHDIQAVRYLSDRVAVMYRGEVVESGPAAAVIDRPTHPYAGRLFAAVPTLTGRRPDPADGIPLDKPSTGRSERP
ncbi:ABC transporter ATP-binding protein [Polymorphospora rubra]|uniref:Dipeptide/oligopeptide/nickel ABC transporter ATP-binding protein n=1 Tax=Polymorphospora rubra TaxID=338584 RepID=A0A810N8S7_9ACTN|nr:ABC transporter ATP-binding protein [Polymorphospora rubra]BCJ68844.1 dipeptide/oligopeptide/nickel ABC transporter ATP-binding protein [Polymorphospora rubra]